MRVDHWHEIPDGHASARPPIPLYARPALDADIAFLEQLGIARDVLDHAQTRAHAFNIPAADALLRNGPLTETAYFRLLAFHLGLPFTTTTRSDLSEPHDVPAPREMAKMEQIVRRARDADAPANSDDKVHIAPGIEMLPLLKRHRSAMAKRAQVTTRTANRAAVFARFASALHDGSVRLQQVAHERFSAQRVITPAQLLVLLIAFQVLGYLAWISSDLPQAIFHGFTLACFLACISVRAAAALTFARTRPLRNDYTLPATLVEQAALPPTAILVPVRYEEQQIEELANAIFALDWPRERLDIRFICDSDDPATIAAVNAAIDLPARGHMRCITVPAALPRTKPRVLNVALQTVDAERVVIYDAEDRPHPGQLLEAHRAFAGGPPDLACLQAPLAVHNARESWWSSLFAVEYASLFDGLLPFLANMKAPLPLGGTSNHFKMDALRHSGAWDAWNVTEDADLGIRLARHGYRTGVLRLPTFEEAPVDFLAWRNQRTRWFKGWMQTWLVHMRNPAALSADLGWTGTVMFHVMVTGMIGCALVHPLLLGFLAYWIVDLWNFTMAGGSVSPILFVDIATLLAGYLTFAWLAYRALVWRGQRHLARVLIGLPIYWMALSLAAWRAVWHLIRRPHEWEKTSHRLSLRGRAG